MRKAREYLRKHQFQALQVRPTPSCNLGLVVVIPCYCEPTLGTTLNALWACARPACDVEVLIVINAARGAPASVHARNRATCRETCDWIERHSDPGLAFHVMEFPALPDRHAGVGLARKLGMDEATARLASSTTGAGIIAALDADCTCRPDYLSAIVAHFVTHPRTPGASIYFEHPMEKLSRQDRQSIAQYELFLRYYVQALRYAGFPHAFQSVGSCIAVRSEVYAAQGGMNRRQAGEDFYFLMKLAALGGYSEIRNTTVYPSARVSGRAPFGTGRAMSNWSGSELGAYAPEAFRDLGEVLRRVEFFRRADAGDPGLLAECPAGISGYLRANGFGQRLEEIQRNTSTPASFRKRFYRWLNAFRVMKYLNQVSRDLYPKVPVGAAATTLLTWQGLIGRGRDPSPDTDSLLQHYRRMDREGRLIRWC